MLTPTKEGGELLVSLPMGIKTFEPSRARRTERFSFFLFIFLFFIFKCMSKLILHLMIFLVSKGSLVRIKPKEPLDGTPFVVGLLTILRQFHPSYTRSVKQRFFLHDASFSF